MWCFPVLLPASFYSRSDVADIEAKAIVQVFFQIIKFQHVF